MKVPNANGAFDAGYRTINKATRPAVKSNLIVTVDIKVLTKRVGDFSTAPFTQLNIKTFKMANTIGTAINVSGIGHFRLEK
jgi:hypothetical protein